MRLISQQQHGPAPTASTSPHDTGQAGPASCKRSLGRKAPSITKQGPPSAVVEASASLAGRLRQSVSTSDSQRKFQSLVVRIPPAMAYTSSQQGLPPPRGPFTQQRFRFVLISTATVWQAQSNPPVPTTMAHGRARRCLICPSSSTLGARPTPLQHRNVRLFPCSVLFYG